MKIEEDVITSIQKIGEEQTYDISVEDNHNFVLDNGILSHNSGKTTGAISSAKYVSKRTGIKFEVDNVCPNEQYYISAVKVAVDNQCLVIDEQLETHVGIGSYRDTITYGL